VRPATQERHPVAESAAPANRLGRRAVHALTEDEQPAGEFHGQDLQEPHEALFRLDPAGEHEGQLVRPLDPARQRRRVRVWQPDGRAADAGNRLLQVPARTDHEVDDLPPVGSPVVPDVLGDLEAECSRPRRSQRRPRR
jgi:hypothetical protein